MLDFGYNPGHFAFWSRAMKFAAYGCLLTAALLLTTSLESQNVSFGHPQEIDVQHHLSAEEIRDRLNIPHVQTDAKELADLCASVSTDMGSIKQGLLPKDLTERLRRMEKLSKRMRETLTRASTER